MKQTHHIGYVQTPSVKNLSNVKNALVENGLVPLTTPNEMLGVELTKTVTELKPPVDLGIIHEGKYRIRYFDIDGKILKIEYVADGGKLTPPTKTPNYDPDYLIFDEWNYDIENYVVEQPTDVGATYKTVDDLTYMFCKFTNKTGLKPTINISGFNSIDWGDGTVNNLNSHTYSKEGYYLIKISGNFTKNSTYIFDSSYLNCSILKVYISKSITSISDKMFHSCSSLEIVSIPNSVTSIQDSQAFYKCYKLANINIPNSVTNIGIDCFLDCYSLTNISIPNSVTSIGSNAFNNCYSLKYVVIPQNIEIIDEKVFYCCYSLKYVVIPNSVTSIGSNAFSMCSSVKDYIIKCSTVPILANYKFSNITMGTIMWVNDEIIEDLKVAKNWSAYAGQMKPLSWYPSLTDPNAE